MEWEAKEIARKRIQAEANKNLNIGNQNKHILGHPSNTGTKSPIYVNKDTGDRIPTNTFIIHYGKSGAHIVPGRRQGR